MSNISYDDDIWDRYTLPTEGPKIYESNDATLEFCRYHNFFTEKLENFGISRDPEKD